MRVLRTGIVSCVLALAVASPAAGQAPKGHIDAIKAVFDAQNFTTHYIVENITGFTAPVHVTWSLELTCVDADCPDNTGTLKAPKPDVDKACNNDGVGTDALENETLSAGDSAAEFLWHHPSAAQDPTGRWDCDHAKEGPSGHQGVIRVTVVDRRSQCRASYEGTVANPAAASAPQCIATPNEPPVAELLGGQSPANPLVWHFDGSSSHDSDGSIVDWSWDYGDGTTGNGPTPDHTYAAGGTYTVRLTVTDDEGATGTKTLTITVQGPPAPPVTTPSATPPAPKKSTEGIRQEVKDDIGSAVGPVGGTGATLTVAGGGLMLTGVGAPVGAVLFGVGLGLDVAAIMFDAIADDPPDLDYHAIVAPKFPSVRSLAAGRHVTRAQAGALTALARNVAQEEGYLAAVAVSLNRAATAQSVGDFAASDTQDRAAARFALAAAAALERQAALRAAAAKALGHMRVSVRAVDALRRSVGHSKPLPGPLARVIAGRHVSAPDVRATLAKAKRREIDLAGVLNGRALRTAERTAAAALRAFAAANT